MDTALWILAICAIFWTVRQIWIGFWAWYAERMRYTRQPKLIAWIYKILYGRELW